MYYSSTLLSCLAILLAFSTQAQTTTDSIQLKYRYNVQDEVIILAEKADDFEDWKADNEVLKTFFEDMIRGVKRPRNFELLTFNEGKVYYLKGIGRVDGERVTFAMELDKQDDVLILHRMNHPWFLCKSDGCDSCDFTISQDGRIDRCTCKDSEVGGMCNVKSGIKTTTF